MILNEERCSSALAGDCWSLRSVDEVYAPAIVLLERQEDGSWLGAPLFAEAGEAGERDVLLEPAPSWLFGEVWCALGSVGVVDDRRLFCRLGHLPDYLAEAVRAAWRGETCDLRRGAVVLRLLDDPRVAFHAELERRLRVCGRMGALERVVVRLRRLAGQSVAGLEAVLADADAVLGAVLRPVPVAVPTMRGGGAVPASGAWALDLAGNEQVEFSVDARSEGYGVFVRGDGLAGVEFLRPGGDDFEACEEVGASWLAGALEPLAAGQCVFRVRRAEGDWFEFELVLPEMP